MFHYRFECRLDDKPRGNVKFIVEGDEARREDCVAIHNALIESPCIVIRSAAIIPMDELARENVWVRPSETRYELTVGCYTGCVEVYGRDLAGNPMISASAVATDGRVQPVLLGRQNLPFTSVEEAKRAVVRVIRRDIHGENV